MSVNHSRKPILFRLLRDRSGGVTTIATLALPVLIGAAGLAFDLNRGYQQRIVNQRVADMAALGAALAYNSTETESVLTPTAQDIAIANGVGGANVAAELANDFPGTGERSVRVTVTQSLPFSLASVLGFSGNFNVSATAFASLAGSEPDFAAPCFLALDGGASSLTVAGGASIAAPLCSVAAIGDIEQKGSGIEAADIISGSAGVLVNHGALIADTLRFATTFTAPAWNSAVPPIEDRIHDATTLVDPWAGDAALVAAYDRLGEYQAPATIAKPSVTAGANWNVKENGASSNVTAYQQSNKAHFVFPTGNYTIGNLTVAGGMNVRFGDGSNITLSGDVSIGGGSTVNFGNSNLTVAGNFGSGSSGVTIGNGSLWVGGNARFEGTNAKGNGDVLIAGSTDFVGGSTTLMGAGRHLFGTVDVGGGGKVLLADGDFQASSGVNMSGDSELALGNGKVTIGPGNGNNAIKMMGSARFFMGDGAFSANGNIDTAGGTRLAFGVTGNHYVNGDLMSKGSVLFGRGRYTVNGDFENGTGGTVWPYTSSLSGKTYGDVVEGESGVGFDMVGIDVTFILAGVIKLAGGAKTKLHAPSYDVSGSLISELLVSSESSDDANWTGGSTNAFAGTIHFPNAQVKMAGGNTTSGNGKCMSLIARTIRVNGGAATGSACNRMNDAIGGGSGSTASIRLVG